MARRSRRDQPSRTKSVSSGFGTGRVGGAIWDDPPVTPAQNDPRLLGSHEGSALGHPALLASEIARHYPQLGPVEARHLYSSVHDMVEVVAGGARYALKVYRPWVRSLDDVQWEVDLHRHLMTVGAPVARLLEGSASFIETMRVGGDHRMAVLSEWAPGTKPPPTKETYALLGVAAGQIHAAVDDFVSSRAGRSSTLDTEVDEQLVLLRPALEAIGRWDDAAGLADVIRRFVTDDLERGICHNDLTLDNIHIDGDRIVVFDFDSAGEHWRASEPQGLYHYSVLTDGPWWTSWLAGYSQIRQMSDLDQQAVPYFVLMHQFENTAWKLGLTPTSVGEQIVEAELDERVDEWLAWSAHHCT